jgi:uncharacterized protein (TIGR03437 family)
VSGLTITATVGTGCGVGTAQLSANTNYNAVIPFFVDGSSTQQTLNVILTVGSSTGTVGLTASPNPLGFNVATGSGVVSNNVNINFNGAPATITGLSSSTTTGQAWLQPFNSGFPGVVTVNVNPAVVTAGSYFGTVFVTTTAGQVNFSVNLNVGTTGTTGLTVSPNPLTFSVVTGSGITSQNANVTFNGSPVTVTGLTPSTNSGQGWLQASSTGITGTILVTVNPAFLSTGTDFGNILVSTVQGQVNLQVTLTTSGGGNTFGLAANPNPLNANLAFGSGATSYNVNITYNGVPATVTGVSATTTTGQTWLQPLNSGSFGTVTVNVNPTILSFGTYSGTVFVSTTAGSLSFPVNLTVGGSGTNSSGLAASPNPVTFNIPLVGSGATPQTLNVTFNGAPATITSATSISVGQNWLIATSTGTPGSLTLSINGANLTAGAYSAQVQIVTTAGTLTVPVNLTVGQGGTTGLTATPNPVFLNVPIGSGSSSQNVTITYNGAPASITGVSSSTTTGQNWLQPSVAGAAGTIVVNVFPSSLTAGSYAGTVSVQTSVGMVNFQVNLNVGTGSTSGLVATPNPVTLSSTVGGVVPSQTVTITSSGNPAAITGISSQTSSGVGWLQPFTGATAGSIVVNANTSGLAAGSYSGTVTVTTSAGTTSFQVNLTVGGGTNASGVVASPNPVSFTENAPASAGSQTITATLNGATQAITNATFTPLQIGLTFVNTSINSDGTVTLTVNGVVTTPGFYQGTLNLFTAAGNASVPVTLQFGGSTGGQGLTAAPNPVSFSAQVGGAVASQNVSITLNGFPVTVNSVTATTTTNQNWLLPSLTGTTGGVSVNVNALGLLAGVYSGTVNATTPSGVASFTVTLTVGGGGGTPSGPTAIVSPVALSPVSFQVGGAAPQPQTIAISMTGGGQLAFSVAANSLSGGVPWLSVSPNSGTTPGNVTLSINPGSLAAGTYQGSVTITVSGASNSPITLPISLTVTQPVVVAPFIVAVQNAASYLPTGLSPGLNIIIYGANLGPATPVEVPMPASATLATTLGGTQVAFDGVPAAIVSTSANRISCFVPYAVANRVTTNLTVTYNGQTSMPTAFRVVDAAPGIFTANGSGEGPGSILNQDGSVNSEGNPEAVGRAIQIFLTGEGQTTPGGVDGAITGSQLPTPVPNLPVTVTIGGVAVPAADVTFVGEAPGAVSGILQVNAIIPVGVGSGPAPVVVRVGGVASQANVTVSVR